MHKASSLLVVLAFCGLTARAALPTDVTARIDAQYPSLETLYKDLHLHPELSLQEEKTAARVAGEMRAAGLEVTEKFGGTGVVAVLRNGPGPVVLIRTDMDALPVKEETGLPYASTARQVNLSGQEMPVMHACGHDIHMSVWVGTARILAASRDRWSGTVVFVGQPAEEFVVGARNMLVAGLYQKFPVPTYAIGLHDTSVLAAGTVGIAPGVFTSNADSVDITVRGVGGHGSRPDLTKDPVVLAAHIVIALQDIVSREIKPGDKAVVSIGTIHGGNKNNIIPNEVKLQLTLRSFDKGVREHLIASIRRICRGEAIAAGVPDDLMPTVEVVGSSADSIVNDPALTARVHAAAADALGAANVIDVEPMTGSEDFSQFGRTVERVPLCFFALGAYPREALEESARTGQAVPYLHSSRFAPVPEPTIKTGISALTAAVFELLPKR
jgi:amidohydrolase